ncbi:MAG: tripartite tricarboxylate transporter substrate binding protein [Hydrogenophaga sp.]|jgi:tripartite-type tricarboxylate transporter receptor subunit TctC|uniref:Bug family tripartite tricarboxylate transporter substrate binding protein n=1 Tax=Hydrogenophaga sp. TaxID=1904254 RepID=UPI0026170C94|nr:tripartite tricarboxylate transporter substrate-binding protein [Hydrogenophaga sp.]MCW5668509.1 tripartite tricarboxylate transporter substrate binding protein [Hydrogenophaga sp.]
MISPRKRSLLARAPLLALGLALLPLPALAQAWPSKPVRMIVGYPSGSSPDMQARLIAEPLSRALGQPVVVENRPGASGNIGADLLARADDGHTIGVIGNGPLTSSKYLYARLPYDPASAFAPIALIGAAPLIWVTNPSAGGERPVAEVLQQMRAEGDRLSYGSIGPGSGGHLGMELLKQALGIQPLHVPFNGGPPIINAILGGHVQMTLLPASTVNPLVQAGKLHAVAVTSARRSPLAPTLPSMEDIGAKGINIEVWNAVMAPAGMPAAHQARLSSELGKILNEREMRQKLFQQGWRVDDPSPRSLSARIAQDNAIYREVIARNKIRLD